MSLNRDKPKDIKKLMQEQLKHKAVTRQVDSPYAKYNSRGQLMCVVCGSVVKSAIIWQAHVNKRSHQENLTRLKQKQQQLNTQQASRHSSSSSSSRQPSTAAGAFKRPASPSSHPLAKKSTIDQFRPKGILKNAPTPASSSDDDSDDEGPQLPLPAPQPPEVKVENGDSGNSVNGVPEGFFDVDIPAQKSKEEESIFKEKPTKPKDPPKPNTSEVLPEGFFDDPVADAKARNVEYKDKNAEEWMSFMKEVSAAEQQSRIIIEEDKEEAALTTQIEQASEQIAFLERVVELDREKTTQLRERGSGRTDSGTSEDSSDEEFAPVIWRTKNSLI